MDDTNGTQLSGPTASHQDAPGEHLTKLSIENYEKNVFDLILILMIQSVHNFAQATTA